MTDTINFPIKINEFIFNDNNFITKAKECDYCNIESLRFVIQNISNNKETSLRDEANDWEGVCIPSPIRARESNFASLVAGRSFRPEGRGLRPARNID
jgi:hypothetical protein